MNIKQFLKPDRRKIVISVVLFIILAFLINNPFYAEDKGFPLVFLDFVVQGSPLLPSGALVHYRGPVFSLMNFIIDFIFWYILSCLIIWIYDKFRKKPQ